MKQRSLGSSYDTTVDDIVDKIRQEWKMYQVENIPSAYFQNDVNFLPVLLPDKFQDAYWEKALNECSFYHGHVSKIFLIVMADQSTHTYSRFL